MLYYKQKNKIYSRQLRSNQTIEQDKRRDSYLNQLNLKVLRFDNLQVLRSIDDVLQVIFDEISSA